MSEPILNKGPTPKVMFVIVLVATGLFLLGFAIDSAARSKDKSIGAILPVLLGLLLLVLDFVLLVMFLARRKRLRDGA